MAGRTMSSLDHLWALVLAAGEGKRLSALTQALHGTGVPKQFALFAGTNRSLLRTAVDNLSALVPSEHIVVVVPDAEKDVADRQLLGCTGIRVIAEPAPRGTATTAYLALGATLALDPQAVVAVVPAAHVVERPDQLLEAILHAQAELDSAPVTLFGVRATKIEESRSWIVPGRPIQPRIRSVAEFVFSPRAHLAEELLKKGALWDTLACVAEGTTLWRVGSRQLAAHCEMIRTALAQGTLDALVRGYATITPADLGRHVMARQLGIGVADVTDSGFREISTIEQALDAFPDLAERCARAEASRLLVESQTSFLTSA
jgi:mannose-1-phosphate guanylyltransferase